ncbi:MAG: hypothetical protein GY870_03045, partial [archaeon]|nr:hypothetical protein [archaeon]
MQSLVSVYSNKMIVGTIQQTLKTDFFIKKIQIDEDNFVYMHIWMLYINEDNLRVFQDYVKSAHGLIMLFDVTRRETFENIKTFLSKSEDYTREIPIFLLGNKMDLPDHEVDFSEAIEFSEQYEISHIEFISVKNGRNVNNTFNIVAE